MKAVKAGALLVVRELINIKICEGGGIDDKAINLVRFLGGDAGFDKEEHKSDAATPLLKEDVRSLKSSSIDEEGDGGLTFELTFEPYLRAIREAATWGRVDVFKYLVDSVPDQIPTNSHRKAARKALELGFGYASSGGGESVLLPPPVIVLARTGGDDQVEMFVWLMGTTRASRNTSAVPLVLEWAVVENSDKPSASAKEQVADKPPLQHGSLWRSLFGSGWGGFNAGFKQLCETPSLVGGLEVFLDSVRSKVIMRRGNAVVTYDAAKISCMLGLPNPDTSEYDVKAAPPDRSPLVLMLNAIDHGNEALTPLIRSPAVELVCRIKWNAFAQREFIFESALYFGLLGSFAIGIVSWGEHSSALPVRIIAWAMALFHLLLREGRELRASVMMALHERKSNVVRSVATGIFQYISDPWNALDVIGALCVIPPPRPQS